jgi:diguanylate cyclase (GGDEF)-like protein/PAS domain S-box-containing protein
MSMTLLLWSCQDGVPLGRALTGRDPLIDEIQVCAEVRDLLTAAATLDRFCAVVDAGEAGVAGVRQVVSIDPDAIVLALVPYGDHPRGLDAIRAGAQDYIEAAADGSVSPDAVLRRLHSAIGRSGRVIRRLREHRRMAKVLEHSAEGYLVVDHSGSVLASSPSLGRIWPDGFDHLDTIFEALHPDDRGAAQALGVRALARPGEPAIGEVRAIDRAGAERWFELRINDQSADPAIGGLITNVREITDRVRSDQERHGAEERFRLGFENAAFGMAMCDLDGRAVEVNDALCDILGRRPVEVVGHDLAAFLHPEAPPLRPLIDRLVDRHITSLQVERRFALPDGTDAWVKLTVVTVPDPSGGPGYLFCQFQDVTDQKVSEDALAHQAMHDALTGLPNRSLLEERLATALADDSQPVTVLFVDVDNFKVINDGLGHTVGDQILIELADRLRSSIRADDTAARFGGDEFAVILRGIPTVEAALARAQHLLGVLSEPACVDGDTHFVSVSIGVSRGTTEATAETVLRDADAAMYQAKALGRERVELFQDSFHARAEHRLRTATKMRHALEAGHFHVAYQPFIAIDDERVIGMEALLRWDDPESGPISPGEFIPVAEQTGLIVQLGAWALDEALRQLQVWRDAQPWGRGLSLSVNLSARQLTVDGLVDAVHQSIIDTGVDAGALCLEITETAVMDDIETSIGLMRMMRGLGVELSIDDFGTGYSSLNYLKSLPLTTLKVDRSFIDGLGSDPHDTSIVEAVVALGHALGMRVHAEGVERADQLAELRRIGCDDAQGWLWAPAMDAAAFETWMARRLAAPASP